MTCSPDISIIFPVTDKVDRDHFPEKLALLWKMIQNSELAQMLPDHLFQIFHFTDEKTEVFWEYNWEAMKLV